MKKIKFILGTLCGIIGFVCYFKPELLFNNKCELNFIIGVLFFLVGYLFVNKKDDHDE